MTHKKAHDDLTAQYVRELFDYYPKMGVLVWKKQLSIRTPIGTVAGCRQGKGRIKIGIDGKEYMAHRVIWLWMTGEWPKYEIDHRDEDQSNNRWKNLRHATPSQNHRNRGLQSNNKTGYKGVCFIIRDKKYMAYIKRAGKQISLGLYSTIVEAAEARRKAALKIHGKWAKEHQVPPP